MAWQFKSQSKDVLFLVKSSFRPGMIRKTKYIVMMTKERSTKIVNFMTHEAGVLMHGHFHISCVVKIFLSFKILFSTVEHNQTK